MFTINSSMRKSFSAIIISALLISNLWAVPKAMPKTAKLLPPETVFLVDVGDFTQLNSQFTKTSIYKLYKDPAMAVFIGKTKSKIQEKMKAENNEIVRAIYDSNLMPEGKLAGALIMDKQAVESNEPTALFIVQWGSNIGKITEAVNKSVQKLVEEGMRQESESFQNTDIKTIINKDSKRMGMGFSGKLSYCFVDDCLIGSANIETIKFVIAHLQGATSATLAEDNDYSSAISSTGVFHDIDIYVNIKHLVKTLLAEDKTGQAKTTMTNLGFDNVSSFALASAVSREPGTSWSGKGFLSINGAKKGVCKMLEPQMAPVTAHKFMPSSTYSVGYLNLDIKKVYTELYNILYSFNPMMAAAMQTPILPQSPDGQPGVEWKKDIIDYLGSEIVISQSMNKPFSAKGSPADMLVAIAVTNRPALEKNLALVHSTILATKKPEAKRELLGYTIYTVESAGFPFFRPSARPMTEEEESEVEIEEEAGDSSESLGSPDMPMTKMAFTVTNTHLIFGEEAAVEQAIRALNAPSSDALASSAWFSAGKNSVPSLVGIASFENAESSAELLWWVMKESGKGADAALSTSPNAILMDAGAEFVDFKLLPPFEAVSKYFGYGSFYLINKPEGFFIGFKNIDKTAK